MIRDYYRPTSLDDAVAKASLPGATIIGGGTLVNAEPGDTTAIVDLQVLELDAIEVDRTTIRIGSTATLGSIAHHRDVPQILRTLAVRELPSALRNAATIGGTVAASESDSELVTALLAMDAQLDIVNADGPDRVDLPSFRERALPAVIVSIEVPAGGQTAAERTGRTPMDRPIVGAVAHRSADGHVRLALAGVAAHPVVVDPGDIAHLDPPGDFRGSSEYRRHLASVLAERALTAVGGAR